MIRSSVDSARRAQKLIDFIVLAADLGLTREQMPEWRAFVEAYSRISQDRDRMAAILQSNGRDRAPSLVEVAHMQVQALTVTVDAARRIERSIGALYAKLSTRQRGRADRLLSPLCMAVGVGRSALQDGPRRRFDPMISVPRPLEVSRMEGRRASAMPPDDARVLPFKARSQKRNFGRSAVSNE